MNNLAIEQDIYNLRRDCEEKDATINELTTLLHSSDTAGSKVLFFLYFLHNFTFFLAIFFQRSIFDTTQALNFLQSIWNLFLFLVTENNWARRHYTEKEYDNYKTEEGHGGFGTKGKD